MNYSNNKNVFTEKDFFDYDSNMEASFEKTAFSQRKSDNKKFQ
jgi:hypothetical protein